MIIKISDNLKKQEIWANGTELASIMGKDRVGGKRAISYPLTKKEFVCAFKDPVLMTDTYRICKLDPTLRDTLFALYGNKPRIVEYDGVSVLWDDSHVNVWCPSIDTVLFAKALKNILKKKNNFRSALEIGCGSGFLSKYILAKSKELNTITINDFNPYAIKCAKDNIKDKRARFFIGDGMDILKNKKFDLIICNPPYIPRPKSIDENPYEGVGLLDHLLHHGQKYLNDGGVLILNFSNLCEEIVFKERPEMKMKILEKMKVPLKINNVLNNKKWLKYLIKKGLKKNDREGYNYHHEIKVIAFTK